MDQLKEHPQADRYKFKKMFPKVTGHRNKEEVREDTIAEMKMEDLQGILKEDVDLIFDALVLHDYIEEVDAWLPKGYEPESYFTCVPKIKEEVYKIDETRPTEEGTVFETTINNTKMKALFDTGTTKSVMSGKMYRNLKYHIELMSHMKAVAAMESRLSHQEDPVEIRHLQKELNSLKKKCDRSKHHLQMQQLIIDCCERDRVYVGEIDRPTAPEGVSPNAPPSVTTLEIAEAPAEASGLTTPMPPLEEDMEVGTVDSPVTTAEDELLNDLDKEDSQAQEAEVASRETSEEAGPDTTLTGGETPSTGVTAGLSKLSVSSPRAPPTPESEGPTTSTPQESADDTAPPEAE